MERAVQRIEKVGSTRVTTAPEQIGERSCPLLEPVPSLEKWH
ncbi:hypothetical protein WH7805_00660 [Synechococcus sp. WH 7805]|nr:hypothetical protein WH7805_00660 [Synechococcus sp. WH 7805]